MSTEFLELRNEINKVVDDRVSKVLFAAEFAENVSGGLLRYALENEKVIRSAASITRVLAVGEKMWLEAQSNLKTSWTGFLYLRDGSEESIKFSKHNYYKDYFLDQEFDWEEQYFPNYTFQR